MSNLIKVVVKNRKKTFINEDALSVTSYNDKGIFDILPFHSNFISLITKMLTIKSLTKVHTFQFSEGVLMVQNDMVNIYIADLSPYFETAKLNK
jgi:F0F1-type ATP synthase epsilon subunit